MSVKFNKGLFMELANVIKDDMELYVNTKKEMEIFVQEYPDQYPILLKKAQAALDMKRLKKKKS